MMTPEKSLNLSSLAKYRIRIKGYLDNTWADQLGGMTITNHLASRRPLVTILSGHVIDQAELLGILNTLYSLGFSLLSLEYLDSDEPTIKQ